MSGITKVQDTVTDKLNNMMKTTSFFEQWVIKRFQPMFQKIQQKRWQSEGSSEGKQWDPINPRYAEWKKEKYKDSFGHGEQLLIATGKLYKALTLADDGAWERILLSNTIVLNFDVDYAAQVGEFRPILEFREDTIRKFRDDFKEWVRQAWLQRA